MRFSSHPRRAARAQPFHVYLALGPGGRQYLDSCGVWGDAIIAILGTIAKQERLRISERVKAGLDRVRVAGSRTGPPIGRPRAIFNRAQVVERRAAGQSWRDIAAALDVGVGTVRRTYRSGVPKSPRSERAVTSEVKRLSASL